MMDAKGVRNMWSILVVVNKYNTARVASCWFIIYYKLQSRRRSVAGYPAKTGLYCEPWGKVHLMSRTKFCEQRNKVVRINAK